jgi:hypothetical protein
MSILGWCQDLIFGMKFRDYHKKWEEKKRRKTVLFVAQLIATVIVCSFAIVVPHFDGVKQCSILDGYMNISVNTSSIQK